MTRLLAVFFCAVCLHDVLASYSFSTSSGTITELNLPWTRQGDTLEFKIIIKNNDATDHSVLLSLSDKYGIREKSGSPLFFLYFGNFFDSLRMELAAGESREVTLYHAPSFYTAGRFNRYLNVYEDYENESANTLPITVHSALTLRARNFKQEELAELLEMNVHVPEHFPVVFHNDSADTQVITEFVSSSLPDWIYIENKYIYPLVVLPNDVINFGNIVVTAKEPNIEKLEGPVYLIYKSGSETYRTGISLYITSVTDSALLKPCIEFQLDSSLFGPVKVGNSTTGNLKIVSNRSASIRLSNPQFTWGDTEGFSFDTTSFPVDVPAFGELTVPITFAPTTIEPVVKYRYAVGFTARAESDSFSCDPSITLAGAAYLTEFADRQDKTEVSINVLPNPVYNEGLVSVTGLRDPMIEIYNVLGQVVAKNMLSELSINVRNYDFAIPGTYIARVRGLRGDGTPISLTKSFVVLR